MHVNNWTKAIIKVLLSNIEDSLETKRKIVARMSRNHKWRVRFDCAKQ